MKAIKAVIEHGQIVPETPSEMSNRHDAIAVVLDADPWEAIVEDARPRPELTKARQQTEADFLAGKTTPLDLDALL
jgi:hypothetical protein